MPEGMEKSPTSLPESSKGSSENPLAEIEAANEPIDARYIGGAWKEIDGMMREGGKKTQEKIRNEDPAFYDFVHIPGAFEKAAIVRRSLRAGDSLAQVFHWASDPKLNAQERSQRLSGIQAFGLAMHSYLSGPDGKRDVSPNEQSLSDAIDEFTQTAMAEYEKAKDEDVAGRAAKQNESKPKKIIREEGEEKSPTQSSSDKWKLLGTRYTEDATHNVEVYERREWIKSMTESRDRWNYGESFVVKTRNLLEGIDTPKAGVFAQKLNQPGVQKRSLELFSKLQAGEGSLVDLIQDCNSQTDLKAMRLIGLALLEEGYGESGQRSLDDLSAEQKDIVRLGEVVGMEAERKLIERDFAAGKLRSAPQEQVRSAIKRYQRFSKSEDIPERFRRRFQGTSEVLSRLLPVEQKTETAPQARKESSPAKKDEKAPAQFEQSDQIIDLEFNPATQTYEEAPELQDLSLAQLLESEFPPAGTSERQEIDNFMSSFSEQLQYAQYAGDHKGIGQKIAYGIEWLLNRPALHRKVFGWRGVGRAIFKWSSAGREMANVRARVIDAMEDTQRKNPKLDFSQHISTLVAANRAESPHEPLSVEAQQIVNEDIIESQSPIVDTGSVVEPDTWESLSESIRSWSEPENSEDVWTDWIRGATEEQKQLLRDEAKRRGAKDIQELWEKLRQQPPSPPAAAA